VRLVWSPEALADRRAIFDHVSLDSVDAALHLDELLSSAATLLAHYPHIGHHGRLVGTREYTAHRHYILIYQVTPHVIRVVRVIHASRRWRS
jgi:addiction module RelE/StbE family toxin